MDSRFTGVMSSDSLAVIPLVVPDGAQGVGVDGSRAHFTVPNGEIVVDLPFGAGDRVSVFVAAVESNGQLQRVHLLLPDPHGSSEADVTLQQSGGIWFAVVTPVPYGTSH